MLSVKLWGGIGNQMFQFAFGIYMAKKRDASISFFPGNSCKNLDEYDLNKFKLDLVEVSQDKNANFKYNYRNTLEYRIKRKMIQLFPFVNKNVLVEKGLQYKADIPEKCVLFDGYWQSYRYVNDVESELREKFVFKDNSLKKLEVYKYIIATNSVSVHIRRGDYLQGKNVLIFEACQIDYYIAAVNLIYSKIESPVFFVFSNDIEWAKENFKFSNKLKLHFIDNSDHSDPSIADLFLMSKCKNNIIANSTFSWWAAWLNSTNRKIIIAPKKWYVGDLNEVTKDLIPPNWYRL
jgi:hypothetical protein